MIRDLLPLYVEGLTSEESSRQIEAHMETCEDCRGRYLRMKEDLGRETDVKRKENEREIDYLKKIRKSNLRKVLLGIGSAFAVVLLALFLKLFVIGYPVDSYLVTYANVNEHMLAVGGVFYDSASVYRRYKLAGEDDGNTKMVIYACLPSVWNRSGVFNLNIDLTEVGTDLCFDVVELVFVHTVDHKNQPYAVLDAGLHIIADADGGELCQAKDQELYAQGASQDANHRVGFFSQPNADCHGEHVGEHGAVGVHAQHGDQAALVSGIKHTGNGNQRTGCNVA